MHVPEPGLIGSLGVCLFVLLPPENLPLKKCCPVQFLWQQQPPEKKTLLWFSCGANQAQSVENWLNMSIIELLFSEIHSHV